MPLASAGAMVKAFSRVIAMAGLAIAGCSGGPQTTSSGAPPQSGGDEVPADEQQVEATPLDGGAPPVEGDAGTPDLAELERVAFERARSTFERHCARCHAQGGARATRGALRHFDMTAYPLGGHHADEIARSVREVLGATGDAPTMPRDDRGAVRGDELSSVLAWAGAFEAAKAAGLHGAHSHGAHGASDR